MKDPAQPPQQHLKARTAVEEIVSNDKLRLSQEASDRIKHWHEQIKTWQDKDALDTAFQEGRLTLRTMTHVPAKDYDYRLENPKNDSTRKRVLGLINNDNFQKSITNAAEREAGVWVAGKESGGSVLLDAGAAGIKRRLIPENFQRAALTSQSNKHKLGLHALSASLLYPDKYALKRYEGVTLIVLMPLPLAEDVRIFYQLRDLSKTGGCDSFKSAVIIMANEFTRPQLASSLDMGTIYTLTTSSRHGGPSVKYVRGASGVTTPDTAQECRTNARENYRSILNADAKANEITVAYRKWGREGNCPVFGISPSFHSNDYIEVNIKLPTTPPKPRPRWGGGNEHPNANYEETGFLISKSNFTRRKK